MAWVLLKAIGIIGTSLKALGKVSHYTGIVDSFSSSSKKVTLFKLGDWIRLTVGGKSFVTKKKTLSRVHNTLFTHLIEADKLIDIPKMQMLKMRILNQMNIVVTPSTGKIQFNKIKNKDSDKDKPTVEGGDDVHWEKDKEKIDPKELEKEIAQENKKEKAKEKFEKDQDGYWMIDRDPKHFPTILNYLRTGKVIASEAEIEELLPEAQFYQIQPLVEHLESTLLEKRRKKERKQILEVDLKHRGAEPYFVVPYAWVQSWKTFAYNSGPPPEEIDNSALLDDHSKPLEGKEEGKDFIFVNSEVWMAWWDIYGGGPIIARKSPDIYSPNVLSTLWDITRKTIMQISKTELSSTSQK